MILGSLLTGSPVDLVLSAIQADDFALDRHRSIFSRIVELQEKGETVNRLTVYEALDAHGQVESVGGLSYLADLAGDTVAVNLDSYVALVRDKSVLRKTIRACDRTAQRCYQAADGAQDILAEAESLLSRLGDGLETKIQLRSPAEIMDQHAGGINGFFHPEMQKIQIPTPWPSLNAIIGGFKPNQLIVIAARTGVGKSVAAAQIALYTAQCGTGTAVFSMEMGADEILTRMICSRASVSSFKFQHGYVSREERLALQKAASEIAKFPVWIDDSSACTVTSANSAIRRLRTSGGEKRVSLVVIDYLGLLEPLGRPENRVQEVSAMTRALKRMAGEFRIPVVVLSQLSRASVAGGGGEPELHHLRESGSIEQDADIVIFLHQDAERYEPGVPPAPVIDTKFLVKKQRGGPIGRCTLQLMRHFTRFDDQKANQEPDERG